MIPTSGLVYVQNILEPKLELCGTAKSNCEFADLQSAIKICWILSLKYDFNQESASRSMLKVHSKRPINIESNPADKSKNNNAALDPSLKGIRNVPAKFNKRTLC